MSAPREGRRSRTTLYAKWWKQLRELALTYVGPLLLALVCGGVLMWAAGYSPIESYGALVQGSLTPSRIPETILLTTPLIFTGLAVVFAFQGGLFNIGGEGQLLIGGFVAAWIGFTFQLPTAIHLPLALAGGAVAGGLAGLLPGYLKARLGAHEVITTIMLNHVISNFTYYLVLYPFAVERAMPQTARVEPTAELPRLFPNSLASTSLIVALLTAGMVAFLLWRTTLGFEVRAIGSNPVAARHKGVPVAQRAILAMTISGAIAGLGGAGETLGTYRRFIQAFSPGYGFDGIAVALVAGLNPLGVIPAAVMFGILRAGGTYMDQFTDVPAEFIVVIQALVILFVVAPQLFKQATAWLRRVPPGRRQRSIVGLLVDRGRSGTESAADDTTPSTREVDGRH
jgi:simple sugar transport system permease protein